MTGKLGVVSLNALVLQFSEAMPPTSSVLCLYIFCGVLFILIIIIKSLSILIKFRYLTVTVVIFLVQPVKQCANASCGTPLLFTHPRPWWTIPAMVTSSIRKFLPIPFEHFVMCFHRFANNKVSWILNWYLLNLILFNWPNRRRMETAPLRPFRDLYTIFLDMFPTPIVRCP